MTQNTTRFDRFRRWAGRTLNWGVIPLLILATAYWLRFRPLPALVVQPLRGSVVEEVMGTGTLEARVSTIISPKISGRIDQVLADQGDQVEAGDLLVQLDDEELQQQVAIAVANQEAAVAAVVRLKADKDRAIAVYDQAQRHFGRIKALSDKNATTADDLEKATESQAIATADVARAEAAITEGVKNLNAAEKSLEYQRARLADTAIVAPFAGLIIARHREAGDIAVPGSAVLTLISTDVLWIRAWVDETQMSRLSLSQRVRVVFRSEPEQCYTGQVARVAKEADRETREFVVDVRLEELPSNWAVGQRAEVFIETDHHNNVLTIPSRLLHRSEGAEGVFVAEDGVVRWRSLKLGIRGRETVEVLDGVDESDQVLEVQGTSVQISEGRRVQLP